MRRQVNLRFDVDLWAWLEGHVGPRRRTQWLEDRIREAQGAPAPTEAVRLAEELEAIARRLRGVTS